MVEISGMPFKKAGNCLEIINKVGRIAYRHYWIVQPATTIHDHLRPFILHLYQRQYCRYYPQLPSPRPPTNRHRFAASTYNQLQFHPKHPQPPTTSHYFTTNTHSYPPLIINNSPLPTNNDSLAKNLLAITNFELYFFHLRIPRAV